MTATRTSTIEQITAGLRRLRWWVLVVGVTAVIVFEWIEPFLPDALHPLEIVIYALAIPGLAWFGLTLISRRIERQAFFEQQVDQLRVFVNQLAEHQSGGRALDLLTEYPARIVPDAAIVLFGYDHRDAHYAPLAWHGAVDTVADTGATSALCAECRAASLGAMAVHACSRPQAVNAVSRYCLPLEHSHLRLGRLMLTLPDGRSLTPDQIETLNQLAPELSLAVVMAIAHDEQLLAAGTSARKDERRQLSMTLHNSLAQQIGYLHLSLDRLAGQVEQPASPAGVSQSLMDLRDLAGDAYEQIRDLLAQLRTPQPRSLLLLLEERLRALSQATGIQTRLDMSGQALPLSAEQSQQVLGLIYESLNNIQKHAGATHATLSLNWQPDALIIEVSDDGRGFDPANIVPAGHFGLTMLREMATDLGGGMVVESSPGRGARLCFHLKLKPLPAANGAEPAGIRMSS